MTGTLRACVEAGAKLNAGQDSASACKSATWRADNANEDNCLLKTGSKPGFIALDCVRTVIATLDTSKKLSSTSQIGVCFLWIPVETK